MRTKKQMNKKEKETAKREDRKEEEVWAIIDFS